MIFDKTYESTQNSYANNDPRFIVVHNTDNYRSGADAKAHAKEQHDGNFQGMSAHVYTDDHSVFKAMDYSRGAWHVGVNYGGKLFGTVNNRNSIGVEMCVNSGFDYEKAFMNTVEAVKRIMKETGIDADHVVQHYDVCAKNCPSEIRAHNDWGRFKMLIGASEPNIKGEKIDDSNVEAISKVVYGEAAIIHKYDALLAVAQCIKDMWKHGGYGKTITEVMQNNFSAYGSVETNDDCRRAVHDVFFNGKNRYDDAEILQFRSFTNYSDGNGYMDEKKCASLLEKYYYLGSDARDNKWGHLYFGFRKAQTTPEPLNKQIRVQAGSYTSKEQAEDVKEKLKKLGIESVVKYTVQCGAFDIESNAEALKEKINKTGFKAEIAK